MYDMTQWAIDTFSQAELGDPRRTARLVELACAMATAPQASLPTALGHSRKDLDAAYDLLACEHVDPLDFLDPHLEHTFTRLHRLAQKLPDQRFVLACDTTELRWAHRTVHPQLGQVGGRKQGRGLMAHSVLLLCATTAQPLGLLALTLWSRDPALYGRKKDRAKRPYQEKESFKWEAALAPVLERLPLELRHRCHVVCDQEADVSEFLSWLRAQEVGFVVRSCHNRNLEDSDLKLRAQLAQCPVRGQAQVQIAQRGGRGGRCAQVELSFGTMVLRAPERRAKETRATQPVEVGVVSVKEHQAPRGSQALKWVLLSSAPAQASVQAIEQVRRAYQMRWRCEEFHRWWKTDLKVEGARLHTRAGLEKLTYLKAAMAMKLMEIQTWQGQEDVSCEEQGLQELEWKLLWSATEPGPVPSCAPSAGWAYRAVAKLGGWYDTKRTGRAGPKALRQGLEKLEWLKLGALHARQMREDPEPS